MKNQMTEHGFWDYTTPLAGGAEAFGRDEYLRLLDGMADGGMNSLMLCVKWLTTGYRSALPFLDQDPDSLVIASDNELVREVIREAHTRGIRVWIGAVVSLFVREPYGLEPHATFSLKAPDGRSVEVGNYDSDSPEFAERAVRICEELVALFPEMDGLEVELEGSGNEAPHRAEPYNTWAQAEGKRPFDQLGRPLDPRLFDAPDWRDYATQRRIEVLSTIERAVREAGYQGDLATILETGNGHYAVSHEVNLELFHSHMSHWTATTYEYDKWRHRNAMMDLCIEQPRETGFRTYYLPRGVMTWGGRWPLPLSLEESWRRDIEDVARFRPDGLWWFGCGTVNEGIHVSNERLRVSGYADGDAARRALLTLLRESDLLPG
jgi:hypothetical protein